MKTDRIVNISTLSMGVIFLLLTFNIKEPVSNIGIGPRAWPQFLALIIISLSIFNIFKYYVANKHDLSKAPKKEKEDEPSKEYESTVEYPQNLWISLAMLCLYVLLMPFIGFIFSTLVFIGVNIYIMGLKKLRFLFPIVLIIVLILVVVFPNFLGVPLPRGIGIFNTLSRIFH